MIIKYFPNLKSHRNGRNTYLVRDPVRACAAGHSLGSSNFLAGTGLRGALTDFTQSWLKRGWLTRSYYFIFVKLNCEVWDSRRRPWGIHLTVCHCQLCWEGDGSGQRTAQGCKRFIFSSAVITPAVDLMLWLWNSPCVLEWMNEKERENVCVCVCASVWTISVHPLCNY